MPGMTGREHTQRPPSENLEPCSLLGSDATFPETPKGYAAENACGILPPTVPLVKKAARQPERATVNLRKFRGNN